MKENNQEPVVSLFQPHTSNGRNIQGSVNPTQLTLTEFTDSIRNGRWKAEVLAVRDAANKFGRDSDEHRNAKAGVPAVTLSVECRSRKNDDKKSVSENDAEKVIDYNFLMQIDFDLHCTSDKLLEWKDRLSTDPYLVFIGNSPTGDGLKSALAFSLPDSVVFNADKFRDIHKQAFNEIDEYLFQKYGIRNDKAVKDPFRICYCLWDEDLVINKDVESYPLKFEQTVDMPRVCTNNTVVKSESVTDYEKDKIQYFLELAYEKVRNSVKGTCHRELVKQAYLCGGLIAAGGLDETAIASALLSASMSNPCQFEDDREPSRKTIEEGIREGKKKPLVVTDSLTEKLKDLTESQKLHFIYGKDEIDADLITLLTNNLIRGVSKSLSSLYTYRDGIWVSITEADVLLKYTFNLTRKVQAILKQPYHEKLKVLEKQIEEAGNDKDKLKLLKKEASEYERHIKVCQDKIAKLQTTAYHRNIIYQIKRNNLDIEKLDCRPELVNFENGTYDVKAGKLKPHRAEDYLTKKIEYNYNPDAQCPLFDEFLSLVFDGNKELIDYMVYQLGTYITGYNPDTLTIAVGCGTNGKSFLFGLIQTLLGKYAKASKPKELFGAKQAVYLAELIGIRFVVVEEMTNGQMLSGDIKSLLSRDVKTAEAKFEQPRNFCSEAAIVSFTNNKPKITDDSHGMLKRLAFIPFRHQFDNSERSKEAKWNEKYLAEAEGILAKMIDSATKWFGKDYPIPEEVKAYTHDMIQDCLEQDSFAEFLDSVKGTEYNFEPNNKALWIPVKDFKSNYQTYCIQNRLPVMSQKYTASKLNEMGYKNGLRCQKRINGNTINVIFGIAQMQQNQFITNTGERFNGKQQDETETVKEHISSTYEITRSESLHTEAMGTVRRSVSRHNDSELQDTRMATDIIPTKDIGNDFGGVNDDEMDDGFKRGLEFNKDGLKMFQQSARLTKERFNHIRM